DRHRLADPGQRARHGGVARTHGVRAVTGAHQRDVRVVAVGHHAHVAVQIGIARRVHADATHLQHKSSGWKPEEIRVDRGYEPRLHGALLGTPAEVLTGAAVEHDLAGIEAAVLELLDQASAHQVA